MGLGVGPGEKCVGLGAPGDGSEGPGKGDEGTRSQRDRVSGQTRHQSCTQAAHPTSPGLDSGLVTRMDSWGPRPSQVSAIPKDKEVSTLPAHNPSPGLL